MRNKLVNVAAVAALSLAGIFMLAPASLTYATAATPDVCNNDNVPQSIKDASGCPDANVTDTDISVVIQYIVNGILAVLGTVAVIYIIIGGINYMTSTGDAGKAKKARDTILYAAIGLIICGLSAAIANFVINAINNSQSTGGTGLSTTQVIGQSETDRLVRSTNDWPARNW